MPLKVAHIGAGHFSREAHAPALQRLAAGERPRLFLEGIADLDSKRPELAEAFARDFNYKHAFAKWRQMVDEIEPYPLVCAVQPSKTATPA